MTGRFLAFATAASVMLSGLQAQAAEPDVLLVGEATEVQGCQRLGEVASTSLLGGLMASQGRTRAIASLKDKAKALGGTHIHLLSSNSGYAGSNMLGVAYRCPTSVPAVPAAHAPISQD